MKIYGINQAGSINATKKIAQKNEVQSPIICNQNEIQKNSLAEMIGRSQVSFRGESTLEGNLLEYQNTSLLKGSENFVYNKEDGSIEYEEYTSGNVLKKRYKFNPLKGTEQITLLESNGITTVQTKEPGLYVFEKFDEDGKKLLREESDDDSEESLLNKVSVKYEYGSKEREIIRRYKNGEVVDVEVIDSRTGEIVTEGRLLESKFKREGGWTVTKNIVTGEIYEKERKNTYGDRLHYEEYSRNTLALIHMFTTDPKTGETSEVKYTDDGKYPLFTENRSGMGQILYSAEYSPETLQLVNEISYDSKTGSTTTKEFTEDGVIQNKTVVNKNGSTEVSTYDENGALTNVTVTSKNKKEVDSYDYDVNGKMVKDVHLEYKRNGQLASLTDYIPNTGIIKTKTEYKDENSYVEYQYSTVSQERNVPTSSEEYQYGVLIAEETYFEDGQTVKEQIEYGVDRFFTYTKFSINGRMQEKTYCTDKKIPYQYEKFNDRGIRTKLVKNNLLTGILETTNFDEITGKKTRFIERTKDGQPICIIDFFANGQAKAIRNYNQDGSFERVEYDEYGREVSRKTYSSKNDDSSSNRTQSNSYQTNSYQTNSREEYAPKQTTEEVLNSILNKISRVDGFDASQIPSREISFLLKLTGVESADKLFSINKREYYSLAAKFHPDKFSQHSEQDQKHANLVFQIISNIYRNSPNEGV